MALQSETEFQWNTTERSQLSNVNYLSGDNNMVLLPMREASAAWNERKEEVAAIICP